MRRVAEHTLRVRVKCHQCQRWIDGAIEFTSTLQLVDTPGFLWAGDVVCESCEPGQLDVVGLPPEVR